MISNVAGTTVTPVDVSPGSDTRKELDALNAVAHLKLLSEDGPDEVRVWVTWANFNVKTVGYDTEGTILTAKAAKRCRIAYKRDSDGPVGARCRSLNVSSHRKAALKGVGSLSAVFGKSISCQIYDGAWMTVEGVYLGKVFVFDAGNPDSCEGPEAKAVAEWLGLLAGR
jgi:hypothetical protein